MATAVVGISFLLQCRVYEIQARALRFAKQLIDMPKCIAIHPMGFMVLIGFAIELNLYYVLRWASRVYVEIELQCHERPDACTDACMLDIGLHIIAGAACPVMYCFTLLLVDHSKFLQGLPTLSCEAA